jgi:chromosome segregation ATPase
MFRNLLGSGSKAQELAEMQSILLQMEQAIGRYESLTKQAEQSGDRLRQLGEPVNKVSGSVDALVARLAEIEKRFEGMVQLSKLFEGMDDRASSLAQKQQKAETQIASSLENAERVRSIFEELSQKVDVATDLKDRLGSFLEVEKPFQELRDLADSLRTQVEGSGDQVTRVREQQDRCLDAQKLTNSKMEALDHRRDELSRDLQDKERRVAGVEDSLRGLDGVQDTVNNLRRDFDTLKAMSDFVGQRTAALDAQREAVEGAVARADELYRAMRQIDAGVRQQQQSATTLAALQDQVDALRGLHEKVVERSAEMAQLQRDTNDREHAIRGSLSLARDEMKNAVERFEFETRGLESISQRVTDVRASLTDFETRFKTLSESSNTAEELKSQTQMMTAQLKLFSDELRRVGQETQQLQAMRRELEEANRSSQELAPRSRGSKSRGRRSTPLCATSSSSAGRTRW